MKSALLSIGTELTDGQIINRNAAWLAERLKPLGPRPVLQLTVPDDRALILDALKFCAERADLIVVTGGLGPTSDDFTRDLISEWSEKPLKFDEPSWQHIIQRLNERGYPVHEFQRQQCFFPEGAVILQNTQGTANGFRVHAHERDVVVLPGPPREVACVWDDHVSPWLAEKCRGLDPWVTRSWDCIGLGESQVAAIADPLLQGLDAEVGYRVHLPYVELKLSYPRSASERFLSSMILLESALKEWIVARDGEDAAEKLAVLLTDRALSASRIHFDDQVTGAILLQRVSGPLRSCWTRVSWGSGSVGDEGVSFWIHPLSEHEVRIGMRFQHQTRETYVVAPMTSGLMSERRKQYFAEMALLFWWNQTKVLSL